MQPTEDVLAAIRHNNELFNTEVVGKRNVDALDRLYTANARVLPPGGAMVEGRLAIKAFWKQTLSSMDLTSVKITVLSADRAGDCTIEVGRAELSFASGQRGTGKYVVVLKHEDGAWKWDLDIWNSNE
ncbi:MAG: YybH family protein [Bryobacteraceae bacterium]